MNSGEYIDGLKQKLEMKDRSLVRLTERVAELEAERVVLYNENVRLRKVLEVMRDARTADSKTWASMHERSRNRIAELEAELTATRLAFVESTGTK